MTELLQEPTADPSHSIRKQAGTETEQLIPEQSENMSGFGEEPYSLEKVSMALEELFKQYKPRCLTEHFDSSKGIREDFSVFGMRTLSGDAIEELISKTETYRMAGYKPEATYSSAYMIQLLPTDVGMPTRSIQVTDSEIIVRIDGEIIHDSVVVSETILDCMHRAVIAEERHSRRTPEEKNIANADAINQANKLYGGVLEVMSKKRKAPILAS